MNLERTMSGILTMKICTWRLELLLFWWRLNEKLFNLSKKAIYLQKTHKARNENVLHLFSLVSVKSSFLKIGVFLCVWKFFSPWTFLPEMIKICQFLKTETVFCKKGKSFLLTMQLKRTFYMLFMLFEVKNHYLKCSLNLSLQKMWPT